VGLKERRSLQKRRVDTKEQLFGRVLDATARIKKREDQLGMHAARFGQDRNMVHTLTRLTKLIFICPCIVIHLQITANKMQRFLDSLNLFIFTYFKIIHEALHLVGCNL